MPRFKRTNVSAPLLLTAILVVAAILIYASALRDWAGTLWTDPSYSHGLLVPFISAYLVYRTLTKANISKILRLVKPDWLGYLILLLGILLLVGGEGASLTFLVNLSFLVVLAGIVLVLLGRRVMRAWLFPYAFLFFALPLPTLLYLPFTFHLQLIASAFAGHVLDLFGIPALREGNIIMLPNVSLDVVEACSGVHSLLALLAVATLAAYLFIGTLFYGSFLLLSAPPLAIALNALRITLLGVLSYDISPASAEGLAHSSTGMLLFGIGSAIILWFAARLGRRRQAGKRPATDKGPPKVEEEAPDSRAGSEAIGGLSLGRSFVLHGAVVAAILLVGTIAYGRARHPTLLLPLLQPWSEFPNSIAGWHGHDLTISQAQLQSLGTDSVLLREYQTDGVAPPVILYIAYFPAQHEGTTMHSPLHCIPGAGWEAERETLLPVAVDTGNRFVVKEVLFRKGTSTILVLYWYLQQGAVEVSELRGALRTLWDSLVNGRTDGCLIRVSSPIETTNQAALEHQLDFLRLVMPLLSKRFLPAPSAPRRSSVLAASVQ